MEAAMRWLVHNCQPEDSLVFHFSGHGSQRVADPYSEEKDGLDETLCPLDYETNGMILDNEINEILVRPIPPRAKLHAIIDSCHSGTVLDLPYLCRINRTGRCEWEDHTPLYKHKGTKGGLAICISGCDDNQTSADTSENYFTLLYVLSLFFGNEVTLHPVSIPILLLKLDSMLREDGELEIRAATIDVGIRHVNLLFCKLSSFNLGQKSLMALSGSITTGAMTYSLILALDSNPGITYGCLLYTMRSVIHGADISSKARLADPIGSFVRRVLKFGLRQVPQLSSSERFDIYRKPFLL
ncbi:metacaspase-1-like [Asparagus officinalis]|uniref:metacaspase-1-like n=1 Tax=Asparagus officinalis TaxID=4686 RepID=UPI00098E4B64|nr:metacaspase-1-like [Asparagus officinalis]